MQSHVSLLWPDVSIVIAVICRQQLCPSLIHIVADPVVDKTLSARCTMSDDVGRGSGCSAAPPSIPGCSAKAIYGSVIYTYACLTVVANRLPVKLLFSLRIDAEFSEILQSLVCSVKGQGCGTNTGPCSETIWVLKGQFRGVSGSRRKIDDVKMCLQRTSWVSGNVGKPLVSRGTVPPVLCLVGSPVAAPQQEVSKIK